LLAKWNIFDLYNGRMEQTLKDNLLTCAGAFVSKKKLALSTLGRMAANDSPFFDRLSDGRKTFTARKYDEIMGWFSMNWPADAVWPSNVPRPISAPSGPGDDSTAAHAAVSSADPMPGIDQRHDAELEHIEGAGS
jgi:hypothetical protein